MLEDAQTELDLILQLDPENTKALELSNKIQEEQRALSHLTASSYKA